MAVAGNRDGQRRHGRLPGRHVRFSPLTGEPGQPLAGRGRVRPHRPARLPGRPRPAPPARIRRRALRRFRAARRRARRQDRRPGSCHDQIVPPGDGGRALRPRPGGRPLRSARTAGSEPPVRVLHVRHRQPDLRGRPKAQAGGGRRDGRGGLGARMNTQMFQGRPRPASRRRPIQSGRIYDPPREERRAETPRVIAPRNTVFAKSR